MWESGGNSMDKTAIKNFAVWARRKLIEDIEQKAFEIGITEGTIEETVTISSDSAKVKGITLDKNQIMQRRSLVLKIEEKGYREVIEEVTYTWFNRFIALRFMEVNDYLPSGVRVLSSIEKGKVEPDIIKQFEYVDLNLSQEDLGTLHIMQDTNDIDNLYRFLLVKQCNKLNEILPALFEQIEDYTEILLPNNLLSDGSVIRRLVEDIPEEDYKDQVEIIGWFYQYYISEKKDEVFKGLKKNIKIAKENIPAATQLFTPDWIVKYMVENSLGRLWLEGHPNDELESKWKYYLDEAQQELDVQKQLDEIRGQSKKIRPEDIKVLDPAMGSGHILVYAFDVLYEIYKSAGYSEKDIPKLILEKNLYGLEIDDRAAQLAYFAVMMKARSKSRRIFREKINLNICSIQESNGFPKEATDLLISHNKTALEDWVDRDDAEYLINVFHDAKEYGSILNVNPINFEAIEKRLKDIKNGEILDMFELQQRNVILDKIPPLVKQARIMSGKYDVVCTNPPYMGNSDMNSKLCEKLKNQYPITKRDLSTVFMERGLRMLSIRGFLAMINIPSWMFITTYYTFREYLIDNTTIINMLHLGRGIFGSDYGTTTFIISKTFIREYSGVYRRLFEKNGKIDTIEKKQQMFLSDYGLYVNKQENFNSISGKPMAYWIDKNGIEIFKKSKGFDKYIDLTGSQHITADNERFLREFWEIDFKKFGQSWISYAKGGKFRRWYGNISLVVDWSSKAIRFYKTNKSSNMLADKYLFKEGITWSASTAGNYSCRQLINKGAFDKKGPALFPLRNNNKFLFLGFLNSKVTKYFLDIFSDRHDYQNIDIKRLPFIEVNSNIKEKIDNIVSKNVEISKMDWDSFETSWDFIKHPILIYKQNVRTIKQAFNNWSAFVEKQFHQLKFNEEELNRIFIDIYGLQDELTPEEDDKDVTIRKADRVRDIKSFISYTVGCMFGRYSIDADGLIYAGGEWKDKWKVENGQRKVRKIVKDDDGNIVEDTWVDATFVPDEDNVIPITDNEYFSDDIVSRFVEFVQITFGDGALEENLDYIAETIGRKTSETSRQAIRRYFIKDFYKDHIKTYQKRPIYWLFYSGKNDGFKALIYMHRYDEFTVSRVRTDYLHKLQHMYESEYNRLDIVIDSDASEREKANARKKKEKLQKQMAECLQYDQVIAHVANQRIKIDLDDGVKVNYTKFQDVEVPQGEGKKTLKMDLLAKI